MHFTHHEGQLRIRLCDSQGNPMCHKAIAADQVNSEFLFGCGAFDAVALYQKCGGQPTEQLSRRLENWLRLFNYGTIPFYWGRYEPVEGQPIEDITIKAAQYMQDRGVVLKGHPLCWHTACADWLMAYPNDEILRKQIARIHRDVAAFAGKIDKWDVINEVVIMPIFDKYDNAITRICNEYGQVGLVKRVFDAARETNPNATLLINDFNTSPAYERLLEQLLEAGVSISAIGIQSHQHQGYWGAEKVHDVLRRFSRFGLPLHFTENTLISGELMPGYIEDLNDWQVESWPSTPQGEERQAREMAEMFDILYAHPAVEAITIWDPCDGAWLGAPSGVMHADGTPKPVYDALMERIHGSWETHTTIVTDENGCAVLNGTKGTYTLTAEKTKHTVTLGSDGECTLTL